jgi:ribosome-associated protein
MSQVPPDSASAAMPAAQRFACHVARLLADSRCEDVWVLDVRGISQITDYLVIASGTSDRQIRSVAEDVALLAEQEDQAPYHKHASDSANWVVVDCVNVVVHIFEMATRGYYDLESLWADGRRVDWHAVTRPGQFATLRAARS